jgi:hypothetical protein
MAKLKRLQPHDEGAISDMIKRLANFFHHEELVSKTASKIMYMAKEERAQNPRIAVTIDEHIETDVLADTGASVGTMGARTEDRLQQSRRDRGLPPLVPIRLPPIRLYCVGSVFS